MPSRAVPPDPPATDTEFRPAAQCVAQDWHAARAYLAAQGLALALDPPPRQLAGGLANLNYLVIVDGRETILRRPPPGPLPPGAHDVAREHRILANLWRAFPLAPRGLHLCRDASVLGAPFQLIEFRRGLAIGDSIPPHVLQADGRVGAKLAAMLLDVLITLHRVDPDEAGLGDLGRPDGFLERAVEGWAKRAALVCGTAPCARELVAWLRNHRVPAREPTLLHNDFKLDNVLLDPAALTPVALIDWDQGTRGDPLFDLATLLSYWTEPGDPPALHELRQMPTIGHGFPTRQQVVEAYARGSGRDVSDFRFYRVLALFKLAVVLYQLHGRGGESIARDPRYATLGRVADGLLQFAWTVAQGESF